MKILVAFYSRTGVTRQAAQVLAECLSCDLEEIVDRRKRSGLLGWLRSGRDAWRKRLTEIEPATRDPGGYELVVLGTPVWAFTMAPAVRTYLAAHAPKLAKVAFLCTMGGSGAEKTFAAMVEAAGKRPVATLALKEKDVRAGRADEALRRFADDLRRGL